MVVGTPNVGGDVATDGATVMGLTLVGAVAIGILVGVSVTGDEGEGAELVEGFKVTLGDLVGRIGVVGVEGNGIVSVVGIEVRDTGDGVGSDAGTSVGIHGNGGVGGKGCKHPF